jgi:hypothetical protein
LVRRKDRIIACREHHASLAQQVEAFASEAECSEFESPVTHQIRPCRPTAGVAALKARTVFVRIEPGAPCRRSPIGRGSGLKPRKVQDRGLPAAPTRASFFPKTRIHFSERCFDLLPSPSGQGIWLTSRHSAVRVRQGAPCVFSSVVERRADIAEVAGSTPARRTILP